MRIALGQQDCRLGDRAVNERLLLQTVREAEERAADLLVLPELQLSGYALGSSGDEASCTAEELAALLAGSALDTVVGFRERSGTATYNSACYLERGRPVHVHRKLYLCDYPPFDEHELFAAGDSMRTFATTFGRTAILICNDAWQPFLPSLAVHDGAELLIVPAASSTEVPEAPAYWRGLTRFYARMLQCYVVFVNRVGSEGRFRFWGGSHVIDPLGEVVAEAGDDETLLVVDIDLERVAARRSELPLLRDLRADLLRDELERLLPRLPA